jgi:prepilin-type N-terminal cleavage/methylation domain-containing protein
MINHSPARPSKICGGRSAGMTLLEVLLAMVIFAIGMLALAQLQTKLTRSSADANSRSIAANIAEEIIEDQRNFEVVSSQAGKDAYEDIVDEIRHVNRGGIDYTVDIEVQDYYLASDGVSAQKTPPPGVTASSFKYVTVTVDWNTGQEFDIDASQSTSGQLGSGDLQMFGIIPSIPSLNSARVAAEDDGELTSPPVDYEPGLNPEIVSIRLGDNKFKESTTPEPIVRRRDELVETWFDVITYTNNGSGSTFLRREEFASVSCECTLHAASGSGEDGRQPTVWTGAEYAEGAWVGKQYGISTPNEQSQYCDICCRDHHDTGSGPDSYRPWAGSFSGDHVHYGRSNKGALTPASDGDRYIEACRLVRKDGFFRVAQDFNLQAQNAFPQDYLDHTEEVADYSDYVTDTVVDYFENGTPIPPAGGFLEFHGRDAEHPTALPTALSASSQQLRSRAIYADVQSSALQANLYNCFDSDGDRDRCEAPNAATPLELYPFFDVQVTQLARWTETEPDDPVVVSNEEISNNAYSRGVARLAGSGMGQSQAHSTIESGNTGLISIAPITMTPMPAHSTTNLAIEAGGDPSPPESNGSPVVSGSLTNAGGAGTAVASVSGEGASCTRPTNDTFVCIIDPSVADHALIVSNYFKANTSLTACSDNLTQLSSTQGSSLSANSTTFALPGKSLGDIVIVIQRAPC